MAETLLIGSGNRDKARELASLLEGLPWDVKCLKDFPSVEEPVEDGDTFEANALLKARFYGAHFGVACVADDSGLSVDALAGAPGVYSARYAGEQCSYSDNNQKLLSALAETPWHDRSAHFCCCAAFLSRGGNSQHVVSGTVDGHIAVHPAGERGFGYDPLFVPEGEERTFAEMAPEEKHAISHRGRAFAQIRRYLEEFHGSP
jgi:XTP/dITP diphosphohydrolase